MNEYSIEELRNSESLTRAPSDSPAEPGLGTELCIPQIHMLKSSLPVPQNVAVCGDRVFKEVFKVK